MFYIHHTSCISAQQTFADVDINNLQEAVNNKLTAKEPSYEGIPSGILRRMGKAVRLGVGTALPLLKKSQSIANGIIIGTANGGMEDCIKFLNQIIDYEEGMLTPTNFVQSTTNAIAAQIGLLSQNKWYNTTHVHRGLAFENALMDAAMLVLEDATSNYLVGGIDEISTYNYNIDYLAGWHKKEPISNADLFSTNSNGCIAGEGAAMFWVNGNRAGATAKVIDIQVLHTNDELVIAEQLRFFLKRNNIQAGDIDLFLSGENGDARLLKYYLSAESVFDPHTIVARFKHMTGEFETSSAVALWLSCQLLHAQTIPAHMSKHGVLSAIPNRILVYNTVKGKQHSFLLVEKV